MMDVVDSSMFAIADSQAKYFSPRIRICPPPPLQLFTEFVCRWFAKLLSEKVKLPPKEMIEEDILIWRNKINPNYHPMALSSQDNYPAQINRLIVDHKT